MPELSRFYGIIISMFWSETKHNMAHIHAKYGDDDAVFFVDPAKLAEGKLPKRAEKLVLEWMKLHKKELQEDWELAKAKKNPKKIKPLV